MTDTQIALELEQHGQRIEVDNGFIYFEKNSLNDSDLRKAKEEFETAIKEVPELLGISWQRERYGNSLPTLYIYKTSTAGPHIYLGYEHKIADKPAIFISSEVIEANYAPYFHEFTHLITEEFWSISLREGLADFVQFYLRPGQRATMKKVVTDFHSHAREILKKKSVVLKFVGAKGLRYESIQERSDFYQLSRSFVTYLIHRYGGATFLELYESENTYRKIYHKSLNQLKDEWIDAVKKPLSAGDITPNPFHYPRTQYWWRKLKKFLKLN